MEQYPHADRNNHVLCKEIEDIYMEVGLNASSTDGTFNGAWNQQWRHDRINLKSLLHYFPTLSEERKKWTATYIDQLKRKVER
jgi:hypothetical protein